MRGNHSFRSRKVVILRLDAGADDFMMEPFDIDVLAATCTSTTGSTTAGEYQYPKEQKKFDFNTWAAVQQMNRGQQGLQSVPKGGYIPVMKDGKARRFFQGR